MASEWTAVNEEDYDDYPNPPCHTGIEWNGDNPSDTDTAPVNAWRCAYCGNILFEGNSPWSVFPTHNHDDESNDPPDTDSDDCKYAHYYYVFPRCSDTCETIRVIEAGAWDCIDQHGKRPQDEPEYDIPEKAIATGDGF